MFYLLRNCVSVFHMNKAVFIYSDAPTGKRLQSNSVLEHPQAVAYVSRGRASYMPPFFCCLKSSRVRCHPDSHIIEISYDNTKSEMHFGDSGGLRFWRMKEGGYEEFGVKDIFSEEDCSRVHAQRRRLLLFCGDETRMALGTTEATRVEWIGA